MLELDREVFEKYNLEIKNIMPRRDEYIVHTAKGKKVIRKCDYSGERILFIHAAKEHLFQNGFKNLDRYLPTVTNLPYITVEGTNFTICDFIEGRDCNFDLKEDLQKASRTLAAFHKSSQGFLPSQNSFSRNELGNLPNYFRRRLDEIKRMKKIAKKGKSIFDYLFLEYFDYFYLIGETAFDCLVKSNYSDLVEIAYRKGILCHHDFTYNNIICSSDQVWLVNYELCCFELKVYDIANFLRRKMRKCDWDIDEAKLILDTYRTIEPITEDEFYLMKIILQFPQKFWRVINKYYNSKRSWSERSYVTRLQEVIDEIEPHRRFMERYETLW